MKKILKPFTGESFLLALGLTAASYIIFPLIKEMLSQKDKGKKGLYYLDNKKEEKFIPYKSELE